MLDGALQAAEAVRAIIGGVRELYDRQGDVAGHLVHPRRVVVREPAGGIAPSKVGRNAVGRLGLRHVGHAVRVAYGGGASRP